MSTHRWRGGLSLLGLSLLAAASFAGCGKVESSRGGLMLLVSTDGPVAIDRVDITIAVTDRDLLANKYRVPAEVALPTTVAIVSNGDPTAQATISVTGWAGSVPVDRRDAIVTQIPTERVAALNVVLSARCTPKLSVGFDGNAVSDCGDGNTCNNAGYCVSAIIQAQDLPTYRVGDENDAGSAGASDGSQGGSGDGTAGGNGGAPVVAVGDAAGAGGSAGSAADGGAGGAEDGGAAGAAGAAPGLCGNHQLDSGEQCDDGVESKTCDANCTIAGCGDGTLNAKAGEQCDDGNALSADGCSAACKSEVCGNLKPDPGEVCDDGNTVSGDGCSHDCKSGESCGNGTLDVGEECDDGNAFDDDDCVSSTSAACKFNVCGDGHTDKTPPKTEECDDAGQSASCNSNCTKTKCGDKIVNAAAGEQCDFGGETALCNANCTIASCGDHIPNASRGEACDDGGQSATCDADCTVSACGDGTINTKAGEVCDEGVSNGAYNHCATSCKGPGPRCGDGLLNGPESCDTGGGETASCNATCTHATCGDGYVNQVAGEKCEPPNTATCDANCKVK